MIGLIRAIKGKNDYLEIPNLYLWLGIFYYKPNFFMRDVMAPSLR